MKKFVTAALVAAVLALTPGVASAEFEPADCIRVMGFSQTGQWFPELPDAGWEAVTRGGTDVVEWADPAAPMYSSRQRVQSPCGTPTVGVFQVALNGRRLAPEDVLAPLAQSLENIRNTWSSIGTIYLVPVVGGPQHQVCAGNGSGASTMHNELIDPALVLAVNGTDVLLGPDLLVGSCSQYSDPKGHLTSAGAVAVAAQVENW